MARPRTDSVALASPRFQHLLVLGVPVLALLAGAACALPSAWTWVLAVDLWLLSFPHVASTFSRTALRREDIRRHRWLLFALPPLALAFSAGITLTGGLIALNTVYFFWQTYHYARQSRGIARALRRAAGRAPADALSDAVIYLTAAWGLAHRCAEGPKLFFGVPLWAPSVPRSVEVATTSIALTALFSWVIRTVYRALTRWDPRDAAHHLYALGHVVIFTVGYVATRDATRGWIVVNVWHNAQYLLFAWAYNHRRFAHTLPLERGALAWISLRGAAFYVVFAALGALGYSTLFALADLAALVAPAFPAYLVLMHAVNFQHYVADATLWRAPARPSAEGLAPCVSPGDTVAA